MRSFMGEDFLLYSESAKRLYHDFAVKMPIFDYHNHLPPQEIFEHKRYDNIAQVWLYADHYKWRAMRAAGIDEEYVTGSATDYDKFLKWAAAVERIPGNPLYHWTHLELKRYFGVNEPLNTKTAPAVWEKCNDVLKKFDAPSLLRHLSVEALCTTDEPADTLEWHQKIQADDSFGIKVLPTFRPDKLIHIEDSGFASFTAALGSRYGVVINTLDDLKTALVQSVSHFKSAGCLLSDHGFIKFKYAREGELSGADGTTAEAAFKERLAGKAVSERGIAAYKGVLLRFLAGEYVKAGFAMQLHLGALRDNNAEKLAKLGVNCGCDSVGDTTPPELLSAFLNDIAAAGNLPNTVLYCLNPADNAVLSTMAVNYADGVTPGKVQFGSAWWFEDHVRGISAQIDELLETGLLPAFIGMLTDSRSFTSFSRHEYFRRILCNKLGEIIENGEYPADEYAFTTMGAVVQDICYNNAARFFGLK